MNVRVLYDRSVEAAMTAGELPLVLPVRLPLPDIRLERGDAIFLDLGADDEHRCFYVTAFDIGASPETDLMTWTSSVTIELSLNYPDPTKGWPTQRRPIGR